MSGETTRGHATQSSAKCWPIESVGERRQGCSLISVARSYFPRCSWCLRRCQMLSECADNMCRAVGADLEPFQRHQRRERRQRAREHGSRRECPGPFSRYRLEGAPVYLHISLVVALQQHTVTSKSHHPSPLLQTSTSLLPCSRAPLLSGVAALASRAAPPQVAPTRRRRWLALSGTRLPRSPASHAHTFRLDSAAPTRARCAHSHRRKRSHADNLVTQMRQGLHFAASTREDDNPNA